ncbi:hypothetical protein NUU61_009087 [Penicillium alfredii]|uniref:Uncharacterized protein n=1 Tax=Penicillium alfredii TaxID=1506179 RepID=A0A9W9JWU0_9EURO|nr:uncharacterized protein NUU61_009087 [Penicillium alfredii]KAJ5084508.1 hypothetical protein NUU61_009087 [Penicillium alfredii]
MFGQRAILGSSHDEDSSDIHITCNPNWANETHDGKTYDEDQQKKNKRAPKFWRWDTIHERWRQFAVANLCADQLGFTDHHRRLSPPDVLTLCPDLWDKTDAAKELRNWRDEITRWAVCQRAGVHLNKLIESTEESKENPPTNMPTSKGCSRQPPSRP